MKTRTAPVLITPMMIGHMNKTMTFREITEPGELEKAFRFRYEVYSKSRLNRFLKQNQCNLDIDIHDLHSRHFGLFIGNIEMIGYLRVVLSKETFFNDKVSEVINKFNFISLIEPASEDTKRERVADYPFLSHPNLPLSLITRYNLLKNQNIEIAEASRLIIKDDHRGIKTSAFLIECAMMLFIMICSSQRHAVISCCKDHRLFYERYGFRPFDDDTEFNLYDMKLDTVCLTLSEYPKNLPGRIEEMKSQYLIAGKITRAI